MVISLHPPPESESARMPDSRQQLNAVVPPAVGGHGLLGVVLLDGEQAAVLARAVRAQLHEHDPALARARRTRAEQAP